jgi:hypothetical protein
MSHVVTHEGNGNAYKILVRNRLGERPFGIHRHRRVDICPIKMDNKEIWLEVVNWTTG